jgi:Holliday junction resolvase
MSELFKSAERKMVRDVARRYKSKGYNVRAAYGGFPRPSQIKGITPDLTVTKGGQTIIIEIKSKASLGKSAQALNQLSKYAKSKPGVRFDIIIANPPSIAKLAVRALRKKRAPKPKKR